MLIYSEEPEYTLQDLCNWFEVKNSKDSEMTALTLLSQIISNANLQQSVQVINTKDMEIANCK